MQKTFCDGCGSEIDAERPQASAVNLAGRVGDRVVTVAVVTTGEDGSIPDVCWRCVFNVLSEYGPYRKSPFGEPGKDELPALPPMATPPEPVALVDDLPL